jgi:hypothetical protein
VTARYAAAARQIGKLDEEAAWQRLREFAADMLKLRKVEQNERRLRLVEEKAAVERKAREAGEKKERELDQEYRNWKINQDLERIRVRLFGLTPAAEPRPAAEEIAGNEALAAAQSGEAKRPEIQGDSRS